MTLKTLIKNNLIFLINQLFELYILKCLNIFIVYFTFIFIVLYYYLLLDCNCQYRIS
jgi:hypothetical protein